jgi:hypothetical protein
MNVHTHMRIASQSKEPLARSFVLALPVVLIVVSRQLQAIDCDVDGGMVTREIAGGLCIVRALLSLLSRNSHLKVDNEAILTIIN